MDLRLPVDAGAGYSSGSQWARRVTEAWAAREMYCPACTSKTLRPEPPSKPVIDFACPRCGQRFQLKSKQGRFGGRVSNSAYGKKMEALRRGLLPNYIFLGYNRAAARVVDLFGVPSHFFSPSIIRERPPLKAAARRAGWIGSEIILGQLPPDARVAWVADETVVSPSRVRQAWKRFAFLATKRPEARGWLSDVLAAVRDVGLAEFGIDDVYEYEDEFAAKHPENRHVRPKIRQQLQVLRDRGILEFAGRGRYRLSE